MLTEFNKSVQSHRAKQSWIMVTQPCHVSGCLWVLPTHSTFVYTTEGALTLHWLTHCLMGAVATADNIKVYVLVTQSCPALCNPMDCSPPGSSVFGILEAKIMEWVAVQFSRASSQPRDWPRVSCIAGRFITVRVTREAPVNQISN